MPKQKLQWSEVKSVQEIVTKKLFDQTGVYLHFLKLKDNISRVIYIGSGNIYYRQKKYWEAYNSKNSKEFMAFNLDLIQKDVYSYITNFNFKNWFDKKEYQVAETDNLKFKKAKITYYFLPDGHQPPDILDEDYFEIRKEFCSNILVSCTQNISDIESYQKIEAVLQKYFINNFKFIKHNLTDYTIGFCKASYRFKGKSDLVLENNFPKNSSDWFSDLKGEVEDEKLRELIDPEWI
ncbi:MAG: hypothetical protein L0Y79_08915 [Chlorobi bacterium]|nr:hypothetical protein [Chlorobiota bacterium]MCI0714697.1 hypothetical protein [Chlorobiota bacterium]